MNCMCIYVYIHICISTQDTYKHVHKYNMHTYLNIKGVYAICSRTHPDLSQLGEEEACAALKHNLLSLHAILSTVCVRERDSERKTERKKEKEREKDKA